MQSLQEEFAHRCRHPSDINEHLPLLSALASKCQSVVEFGVRNGNSTVALVHGLNEGLSTSKDGWAAYTGYDRRATPIFESFPWAGAGEIAGAFFEADTSKLPEIPACDFLFIDSLHTADHVKAELKHATNVTTYIGFHDTMLFGERGEDGKVGIMDAIRWFLARNPKWKILYECRNNNGLIVLERVE